MTKPRRPSRAPSQSGLYPRGNIIWMRYQDAAGKWKCASSGLARGREAEAAQLLVQDDHAEGDLDEGAAVLLPPFPQPARQECQQSQTQLLG